mgnify:FL=1
MAIVTNKPLKLNGSSTVEIKVLNKEELPQFSRGSKHDPYVEKFKSLKVGQALVVENKKILPAIYGLLSQRGMEGFSTRTQGDKGYIIKNA